MPDALAWTTANLAIQTVTGIVGAHIAAAAAHEHRFGFLGHTLVGVIAGAASGCFLQQLAVTMVTEAGTVNGFSAVDNAVIQGFTGIVVGGCAMLVVGLAKRLAAEHAARQGQASKDEASKDDARKE
jgi:ABC-type uncharacterized transport system permease subunit